MSFDRLLLPTDFADTAGPALRHAQFLARRYHATLHVLHVVEDVDQRAQAESDLSVFLDAHRITEVSTERVVVTAEAPGPAIRDYAATHGIGLMVMGTHGRRGLERLFLGSITEEVIREAPCPVLTVRASAEAYPEPGGSAVLAPLDLSESSFRALPLARTLAAAYGVRLDLLHVLEDIDLPAIYGEDLVNPLFELFPEVEQRARAEMERAAAAAAGPEVPTAVHFTQGHAAEAIVDFAEEHGHGLIVLSRTGRRGLTRFLIGSVTDAVVRTAPCPVLVVPVEED